jgi:hypothetical protein
MGEGSVARGVTMLAIAPGSSGPAPTDTANADHAYPRGNEHIADPLIHPATDPLDSGGQRR